MTNSLICQIWGNELAVGGLLGVAVSFYLGIVYVRRIQQTREADNGNATWKLAVRLGAVVLFGIGALIMVLGSWYPALRESISGLLNIAYDLCMPAILVSVYSSYRMFRATSNGMKALQFISMICSIILLLLLCYFTFFSTTQ